MDEFPIHFIIFGLASRRGAVRPVGAYFPDNDRRSIHYPLLITRLFLML